MAEGASRDRWQHTSSIMALLANINRNPKRSRPFRPGDFNPYMRKHSNGYAIDVSKDADGMRLLREAFTNF